MIDKRTQAEMVALLQALVRIRSVNPPGNEDEIAFYIRDFLANNGIDTTLVPLAAGRSSVVAHIPGDKPGSIVLCGHIDTVDVNEAMWTYPPFAGRIEKGRIYGRGTADMKGGVAVILMLARLVARGDICARTGITLALTADEEERYQGAATIASSGLIDDARLLVITEPTDGQPYLGQKGELWVEATFTGKAAHGAVPELGINTIIPAAAFSLELAEKIKDSPEFAGRGRTSLNIGEFTGGWRVNVVPDSTKVKLDFRTVSTGEKERVLSLVNDIGAKTAYRSGARFAAQVIADQPLIVSDAADPYVQEFLAVAGKGAASITARKIVPYCTDAVAIVPARGIPLIVYGPGSIAQAHQPDEYIELASLYEALDLLARFIGTSGGTGRQA